ncbi:hypothetical protein Pelo_17720 [Pelomyxa schiedti]|nr:hypothetical protein Pelo_17720 [Pelomyxa schiedti]
MPKEVALTKQPTTEGKKKRIRVRSKNYRKPSITDQMILLNCVRCNTRLTAKVGANWEQYIKIPDHVLCNAGVTVEPVETDLSFSTYYTSAENGGMKTLAFSSAPNPGVPQLPLQKGSFLEISDTDQGPGGQFCFVNITKRNNKAVFEGNLKLRIVVKTAEGCISTPYVLGTAPVSSTTSTQITHSNGPSVSSPPSAPSPSAKSLSPPDGLPTSSEEILQPLPGTQAVETYPEVLNSEVSQEAPDYSANVTPLPLPYFQSPDQGHPALESNSEYPPQGGNDQLSLAQTPEFLAVSQSFGEPAGYDPVWDFVLEYPERFLSMYYPTPTDSSCTLASFFPNSTV